jgi:hypothetical protein
VSGRQIYWVEAMTQYSPPAYRFLLAKNPPPAGLAKPYDPTSDNGPLRFVNGRWYWKSNYTSEFMIDEDLSLDRCTGFDFVSHHSTICRLHGSMCRDRSTPPFKTGARILAFLLSQEHHNLDKYLRPSTPDAKKRYDTLDTAVSGIWWDLVNNTEFEGTLRSSASCESVVLGAFALYAADQKIAARDLLALIASSDHFEKALTSIIRQHFKMPDWELRLD